MSERKGFYGWLGNTMEHRSGWVIIATLLVTVAMIIPFAAMVPTESASENPTGNEVVKLWDHIDESFSQELYWIGFIVEAEDGDMLTRENLYELYRHVESVREGELGDYLYYQYDEAAGMGIDGTYTLADAVNYSLMMKSSEQVDLSSETVTDAEVKQIIEFLFENPQTEDLRNSLSGNAELGEEGWTSPAIIVSVLADDETVLKSYLTNDEEIASSEDLEDASLQKKEIARERYARAVQELMRDGETVNETIGVAIDLNLEIEDEGKISGMLLGIAMLLIAVLLLVIFRSWMIMLITSAGLVMLIIWLKGFSNLIGLKSSMTLDLIVPITIVVLGVDYAIQALFRYRQEMAKGLPPSQAIGSSTFRVGRALVLAMFTTMIAFGSNATAGIESVVGFAIAASFAMVASFAILGLFVPSVNTKWQARKSVKVDEQSLPAKSSSTGNRLGNLVVAVSDKWFITLPVILIVSIFAAWGWLNVETKFDPKDALKPSCDFVVGLDKWDEHGAKSGGEPSLLYYEGDLTQLEAVEGMRATIDEMNADGEEKYVGTSPITGKANAQMLLLDILELVTENEYVQGLIQESEGIQITDEDNDLLPDNAAQIKAAYNYVLANGFPQNENTIRFSAKQIGETFIQLDSGAYAAYMAIGVPGTREQSVSRHSGEELNKDMDIAMEGIESITKYGLTGTGDVRVVQFDAIADALTQSLIIAVAAVLLILLVVFRSIKYAVLSIVPVILVACWLYGFMYLAGHSLNMLTATIAAISIGVGIDFTIHFVERFREELENTGDKREAIRVSSQTTGLALFCAAITTLIGFMVITLAPMPLFAIFGELTAIMIALSLFMALFALPSLLMIFVSNPSKPAADK